MVPKAPFIPGPGEIAKGSREKVFKKKSVKNPLQFYSIRDEKPRAAGILNGKFHLKGDV